MDHLRWKEDKDPWGYCRQGACAWSFTVFWEDFIEDVAVQLPEARGPTFTQRGFWG